MSRRRERNRTPLPEDPRSVRRFDVRVRVGSSGVNPQFGSRVRVVDGVDPDEGIQHETDEDERRQYREKAPDDEGEPPFELPVVYLTEAGEDRREDGRNEGVAALQQVVERRINRRLRRGALADAALGADFGPRTDALAAVATEDLVALAVRRVGRGVGHTESNSPSA